MHKYIKADHSIEAEQCLLGAIMVNAEALSYCRGLEPEHFFEPLHQQIFAAMMKEIGAGRIGSPTILKTHFADDLVVAGMKIGTYLARVMAEATTIINAVDYSTLIQQYAMKRDLCQTVALYAEDERPPDELNKIIWEEIDRIRQGALGREGRLTTSSAAELTESFETKLADKMAGKVNAAVVPTYLTDFDGLLNGGFMRGCLYIGAGRPGMGKSTVASSIARRVAYSGTGAYFFSMEMGDEQIAARVLADEILGDHRGSVRPKHRLTYDKMIRGVDLTDAQAMNVVDAARFTREMRPPLEFDFEGRPTLDLIGAKVRRMQSLMKTKYDTDLGFVVFDYLKFIQASRRYQGQRVLEVGEITGALKQLAKSTNTAILLLVQLNREVEKRSEKVPQLSDLRESGEIEQDADVVLFFYREAYYIQTNPNLDTDVVLQAELAKCFNKIQLIIGKNRHGPIGNINLYCDMGSSAIRDNVNDLPYNPYPTENTGGKDQHRMDGAYHQSDPRSQSGFG
jgi:replicative DNA helicase